MESFSGNSCVPKYHCIKCDYKCNKKYNWKLHLHTIKHNIINECHNSTETGKNWHKMAIHSCENCGKEYKDRSGLWKHKKKCVSPEIEAQKHNLELQKQNLELHKHILEICKNLQPGTMNNSHNNNNNNHSNNKTFNLHFFLNETCKNAMNISEFIENISLQLSDLENMGKLGYVEGVSKIIIKNLNALEVTQRPLHCTDKKREVVYVKDEDEWQKEEEDKKRIREVISNVVSKNMKLLPEYENKYPECMNPESKKSDEYNKIIMESMGGGMDVVDKNKEKIIKKVSKSVLIEKEE
uniref:C2H2-type domain-containing protein n=1 Tax=viral metagenome TaxID=1070528 RepID=A0A6C0E539_9ZZZZ